MKESEVTKAEKKIAQYIFDEDEICGTSKYDHVYMISLKSGKTIRCINCSKHLRNGTAFAKELKAKKQFVSLGVAIWYWKLCRNEREQKEYEDWAYW